MLSLHYIANSLSAATELLQKNLPFVLTLMGGLYLLQFVNAITHYRLNIFGILPRHPWGLIGIFTSPFLHASFNHLFFNSIPLFVLICFLLLSGFETFVVVSFIIILLGGLGTWILGRRGLHVGASGLIMGYWSYLLICAYQEPTVLSIALAIVCLYYFGGLIFNLFPMEIRSSFEAHIFGFIAGIAAAYFTPLVMNLLALHGYHLTATPISF